MTQSVNVGTPPLDGVVVADFSRVLAGPYCTLMLADLGAEIIKIERPDIGDDTRAWGPPFIGDDAVYYLGLNRDKKSVTLDLTKKEDRQVAIEIVSAADVVVENFTSGVMARYGLEYEAIAHLNPKVVYCSITAYLDRPEVPGYDLLMQATSGMMSVTGPVDGTPTKVGVAIIDVLTGLHACVGILAALAKRQETGRGQHVRAGLFESAVASLVNQTSNYLLGGLLPVPSGNQHPNIVPYESYEAADGLFVLAIGNDKLYRLLCDVIERADLSTDLRFINNASRVANRHELNLELQQVFGRETVGFWMRRFSERSIPAAPIRSLDSVFASPEGIGTLLNIFDQRRGEDLRLVKSPIELSHNPLRAVHTPPPTLGEHDSEVRRRFSQRNRSEQKES